MSSEEYLHIVKPYLSDMISDHKTQSEWKIVSEWKSERENHVILLMTADSKKWHYLTVKSLYALLKGTTSNHKGDFYCLNCFQSYCTVDLVLNTLFICNANQLNDFYLIRIFTEIFFPSRLLKSGF